MNRPLIRFRIDLDLDVGAPELSDHRVEVADAEVQHESLLGGPKISSCWRKRFEDRGTGRLLQGSARSRTASASRRGDRFYALREHLR